MATESGAADHDGGDSADGRTSVGRLGRDAVIYGLGFIAQRAAGFIMLPIYTRYLVPADYATLHLLQMSLDVAAILLSAGLTAGVLRFSYKTDDRRERSAVAVAALWMTTLFNILGAIGLFFAAPWIAEAVLENPDYVDLVYLVAIGFVLEPLLWVPTLVMQVEQRAGLYTFASVGRLVIQLALNILFVVFLERGVRGILWSTIITYVALCPILLIWMFRHTGFPFSRSATMDLLRFGLPYRITEAGTFVLTYVDRYVLAALQGLTITGVYSLAYQFGFVLAYLATTPFMLAWDPQRFQLVERPRAERDAAYDRGFRMLTVLAVTMAVGIALFVTPTLTIISDAEYHGASPLVPVILCAYLFQAWSRTFEFNIQVAERTLWVTAGTWVSVVVIVGLYALCIPVWGAMGAAVATLVAFAVRALVFHVIGQRLFPITYTWRPHVLVTAYGAAAVVAYFVMAPPGLLLQIALATGLFLVYAGLAWRGGVLSGDERRVIVEQAWLRARQIREALASQPG